MAQAQDFIATIHRICNLPQIFNGNVWLREVLIRLASELAKKVVFVAEPEPDQDGLLRTLVVVRNLQIENNFSFNLDASPCREVFQGRKPCVIESNVQNLFPVNDFLQQLGIESYVGFPLVGGSGNLRGLLAVFDDKPFAPVAEVHALLEYVAVRFGVELDRIELEQQLDRERKQQAQHAKMQAIGQLAGGIAHDFNNTLGSIISSSDLLTRRIKKGCDEREILRLNDVIIGAALRGADLTAKLLAFGRPGAQRLDVVDIHACLHEVKELVTHSFGPRYQLHMNLNHDCPYVFGEPSTLHHAIVNLCLNARDAMPDGGDITITTSDCDESRDCPLNADEIIHLQVRDTGMGIHPEDTQRVFDPFFTTKQKGEGTGLGLAAVFSTVQSLGGTIEVASEIGVGTTFDIFFSVSSEEGDSFEGSSGELLLRRVPRNIQNILVVDDDPFMNESVCAQLEDFGAEVFSASSGEEMLLLLQQQNDIDLIILDMVMPGLSCEESLQQIEALPIQPQILLISGFSTEHSRDLVGAYQFLAKPFKGRALLNSIGELAASGSGLAS